MKRIIVSCMLILSLVFGGFLAGSAIADVPSSTDGTITACVRIINNNVRIVDAEAGETCSATLDDIVSIMASGGTVYSNYETAANQVNGTETVGSVTVPAGKYLVQAKAWVDQTVGLESFVQCSLVDLGIFDRTRLKASDLNFAAVVATEVAIFPEETIVEYVCVSDARVDVYNVVLTATTVSALNLQ